MIDAKNAAFKIGETVLNAVGEGLLLAIKWQEEERKSRPPVRDFTWQEYWSDGMTFLRDPEKCPCMDTGFVRVRHEGKTEELQCPYHQDRRSPWALRF